MSESKESLFDRLSAKPPKERFRVERYELLGEEVEIRATPMSVQAKVSQLQGANGDIPGDHIMEVGWMLIAHGIYDPTTNARAFEFKNTGQRDFLMEELGSDVVLDLIKRIVQVSTGKSGSGSVAEEGKG